MYPPVTVCRGGTHPPEDDVPNRTTPWFSTSFCVFPQGFYPLQRGPQLRLRAQQWPGKPPPVAEFRQSTGGMAVSTWLILSWFILWFSSLRTGKSPFSIGKSINFQTKWSTFQGNVELPEGSAQYNDLSGPKCYYSFATCILSSATHESQVLHQHPKK